MLTSLLLLGAASLAVAPTPPAAANKPMWSVQTRFVHDDGKKLIKPLQAPKVTVEDGRVANISDISQTPFVTAVKYHQDGKKQIAEPVITVLSQGTQINMSVTGVDEQHACLDVTVEYSTIDGVEEVPLTDDAGGSATQSPRLVATKVRTLKTVRLGDATTVKAWKNDKTWVEFVVKRYEPRHAQR